MQILITALCVLLIAAGIVLFIASLCKMAKGKCCEGCAGCKQADNCSTKDNHKKTKN